MGRRHRHGRRLTGHRRTGLITTMAGTLGSFLLESHTEHQRPAVRASAAEEHGRRAATGEPR